MLEVVIGIDPSATATGVVCLKGGQVACEVVIKPKMKGIDRQRYIVEHVMDVVECHGPELIMLEGYAYNAKNPQTLITLVEVGTVLRYILHQEQYGFLIAAPTQLKKFVGVKGKKDMIRLEAFKRWGYEHKSNDIVDAYVLAKMAQAVITNKGLHKYQEEVIKNLLSSEINCTK